LVDLVADMGPPPLRNRCDRSCEVGDALDPQASG
jgi:hypothetical protein